MIVDWIDVAVSEEEMSLNKTDKEWIGNCVAEKLKTHRPHQVSTSDTPNPWGQKIEFARLWSAPTIAVAVALFMLGEWGKYVEFRTRTDDTLKAIDTRLSTIDTTLGKIDSRLKDLESRVYPLRTFAEMDPKALAASLPQLQREIQQAATLSAPPPDRATIRAISQKLATVSSVAPQYWPTVGAMITYQSWLATGRQINIAAIQQLKRCAKFGPGSVRGSHLDMADASGKFQGCIVTLDDVNIIDSTIENAIIVFQGAPTRLQNVHFINCLFFLTLTNSPTKPAQDVARTLLTSTGTATITTPPV